MKKITIILIVIALAIIMLFVYYFTSKKNSSNETLESEISKEIPLLPNREIVQVDKGTLKEKISEQVLHQENKGEGYLEMTLESQENQTITLDDFAEVENMKIDKKVHDNLSQSKYQIFSCCMEEGKCKKGIILHISEGGSGKEIVERYENIKSGLKDWEKSIIGDLREFLFAGMQIGNLSELKFSSTEFLTENGANNIEIKYVNFKEISDQGLSFNYAFFDNQIFISNDKDCIRAALNKYGDVLEP